MKTLIIGLVMLVATCPARAQVSIDSLATDSLVVFLQDGSRVSIPLSEIEKITFDSTMAVSEATGTQQRFEVWSPVPNPTRNQTAIEFRIPKAGRVGVSISNAAGQQVRLLEILNAPAQMNSLTWDGLDERGARVASGSYFFEVRYAGEVKVTKVIVED